MVTAARASQLLSALGCRASRCHGDASRRRSPALESASQESTSGGAGGLELSLLHGLL